MISRGSIFYPTYRDIRDALLASSRPSTNFLLEYLGNRGFFISSDLPREAIIEEIARKNISYNDFEELLELIEVHSRNEKSTFKKIKPDNLSLDAIKTNELVQKLTKQRSDFNERFNVEVEDSGKISIKVNYTDHDYGKTVLRQRRSRESKIEIIPDSGSYILRSPSNDRMRQIVKDFVHIVSDENKDDINVKEIDLSTFNRESRTIFFRKLIYSIKGYSFQDVIKVGIENKVNEIEYTETNDNNPSEEEIAVDKEIIEEEIKSFLNKASLDGKGLLHSQELKSFLDSGFFFSRVIWIVRNKKEKVVLEALMEDPVEGKNYKYAVKGIFPIKKDGEYTKNMQQPKPEQRRWMCHLLEEASCKVYEEILNEET